MVTYGLIGEKLGHSFSADFFNKKFDEEGIQDSYMLFPIPSIKSFPTILTTYKNLKGLNVTIPYKQEVIEYLDSLSEEAEQIGAVNVIKISRENDKIKLTGHNSDSIGFEKSLLPLLRPDITKALVLGTGGASKAVSYVLDKLCIKYKLVSRNPGPDRISYSDLDEKTMSEYKLIINTTPLGMYPDIETCPPIPYHFISPEHICYDLVYNPHITEFLKRAESHGAKIKNGLEMLHLQALAAWDIWNK